MLGIDKELIDGLKSEDRLIKFVLGTPKCVGIFNSKREMEELAAKAKFDIGMVRTRTMRLRKGKPDVIMVYVNVQEEFEKLGRHKQIRGNN